MAGNELIVIVGVLIFFNIISMFYSLLIIIYYNAIIRTLKSTVEIFTATNEKDRLANIQEIILPGVDMQIIAARSIQKMTLALIGINLIFIWFTIPPEIVDGWALYSGIVAILNATWITLMFAQHNMKNKIRTVSVEHIAAAITLATKP